MQISMFDFPLPAYFLVSTGEMRSFQTKERRGLLRVEKVATKVSFGVAEDSVGNRVPEKSSHVSQLVFVGFPDGSHRVGTVVSVLKKEGAITCFVGGDSLFFSVDQLIPING